jgi:hypothetical protein
MAAKAEMSPKQVNAKLFWNGRSQAVRLPNVDRRTGLLQELDPGHSQYP